MFYSVLIPIQRWVAQMHSNKVYSQKVALHRGAHGNNQNEYCGEIGTVDPSISDAWITFSLKHVADFEDPLVLRKCKSFEPILKRDRLS